MKKEQFIKEPDRDMKVKEIFEWYDGPVLFSCQDKYKNLFLALYIDETEENRIWYYLPLSQNYYESLQNNRVDLYTAYSNPEWMFLYQVEVSKEQNKKEHKTIFKVTKIPKKEINIQLLPEKGEYLR